jgi:hypothetical protein
MSNTTLIIFFLVAAAGGTMLLTLVLKDQRRPIILVALHGIIALAAYALLSFSIGEEALVKSPYQLKSYAFVAFSFAAVGGLYMFVRDKFLKIGIQKWMPFVHGGLALTGIVILILATVLGK